jgi:hypothetical protein
MQKHKRLILNFNSNFKFPTFLNRIHGGYASGMWKLKKLHCGFLLDFLKGLVHFEGFRNRLASFWPELVVP